MFLRVMLLPGRPRRLHGTLTNTETSNHEQ